jgi:hypothetical protein
MPSTTKEVITMVCDYLDSRNITHSTHQAGAEYYGVGSKREHNIIASVSQLKIRICVRTQFVGGGAWQKMMYTSQMLLESEEDIRILIYHGTDKRFNHHMEWLSEKYNKMTVDSGFSILELNELPRYLDIITQP